MRAKRSRRAEPVAYASHRSSKRMLSHDGDTVTRAASETLDADEIACLERLMRGRFSCRAFRREPVSQDVVSRILEIARHTASWNNVQPWHVIVTRGEATERFRAAMHA